MQIERLKPITCFLTDIDGVMTNGQVFLDTHGEWRRFFNLYDGMGLKRLRDAGFIIGFITTSISEDIRKRAQDLKVQVFYEGIHTKLDCFAEIMSEHQLQWENIAYIGDDLPDVPVLQKVGASASVPHALEAVKSQVHYITKQQAGMGAVREWAELVLQHSDKGQSSPLSI